MEKVVSLTKLGMMTIKEIGKIGGGNWSPQLQRNENKKMKMAEWINAVTLDVKNSLIM